MRKIVVLLLLSLLVCSCGNQYDKKVSFIKQSAGLVNKNLELTKDMYLGKVIDRKTLSERLTGFLGESKSMDVVSGWAVSDTIKNYIVESYTVDIRFNQTLDSLQSANASDLKLLSALFGATSLEMKKNINNLIKDESDKLKIQLYK